MISTSTVFVMESVIGQPDLVQLDQIGSTWTSTFVLLYSFFLLRFS
jgi:hypothetical protein